MNESVAFVTQSKFFSPAFNAAIFDGPIRIYFAQHQEALALKVYFDLQNRFNDRRDSTRDVLKERKQNLFVMIYPTEETFELSFNSAAAPMPLVCADRMGADFVLGVRGPVLTDEDHAHLYDQIEKIGENILAESLNSKSERSLDVESPDLTVNLAAPILADL